MTKKLKFMIQVLKVMKVDVITRKAIAKNEAKSKRRGRASTKLSSLSAFLGLEEESRRV